jgi:type III pantothenate kinase
MILLFDIGNTHTHIGLASEKRIVRQFNIRTESLIDGTAKRALLKGVSGKSIDAAAACSVVPHATPRVRRIVKDQFGLQARELKASTINSVGIKYPAPASIGPDRLSNAIAVKHHFGAPAVVVDFGTAVTFDVVDRSGNYVGGIIAPGLAAMTDYLHEKTALLPRISIREIRSVIGKSTEQAMLIGAVHGYRGLIRQLVSELKCELGAPQLPIVATGGYAALMAAKLPEITAVEPLLTLEGLRIWLMAEDNLES